MCANHAGAAVIDQVKKVVCGQAKVQRHQHSAELWYGVERLELRMSIGREIGDTVAHATSEPLQDRRPAIASIEELGVAPARLTIDHRDLFRINFARAASEFEWRQRRFHVSRNIKSPAR